LIHLFNFCLFLRGSSGDSLLEADQAFIEPWHGSQVIDHSLSAKILMGEYASGVTMAKKDEFNSVNDGNVVLINYEIVVRITINGLSLCYSFWIDPLIANFHRVTWSDQKTTLKLAHFCLSLVGRRFDHTFDIGFSSIWCGDLVSFGEILDKLVGSISHLDGVGTGEATTTVVSTITVIVIEGVHFGCELGCILNISSRLSLCLTSK